MASTRNRNNPGDYRSEHNELLRGSHYKTYDSFAQPTESMLPGDGLLTGRMGSQALATNSCDVESFLYGIGTSNLVETYQRPIAELKPLSSLSIMNKLPVLVYAGLFFVFIWSPP